MSKTQQEIDKERYELADEIIEAQNITTVEEAKKSLRGWIITAAQHCANEDYLRGERDKLLKKKPEDDAKNLAQATLATNGGVKLGWYNHYKGGGYIVFANTIDEATLQPLVHYFSVEHGTRWTRMQTDFMSYVDDGYTLRFLFMKEATRDELRAAAGLRTHGA